jgi:hypothetical protein
LLVVDVKPSRRLGNKPNKETDNSWTQALKPGGQEPRRVSAEIESASDSTCCDDASGEPESVAVSSHLPSVCRVRHLDDVDGSCSGGDGYTETCAMGQT